MEKNGILVRISLIRPFARESTKKLIILEFFFSLQEKTSIKNYKKKRNRKVSELSKKEKEEKQKFYVVGYGKAEEVSEEVFKKEMAEEKEKIEDINKKSNLCRKAGSFYIEIF